MPVYVDVSSAVHAKAGLGRYTGSLVRALRPLLGDRLRLFQNGLGRRGPLPEPDSGQMAGVKWGYKPWRVIVSARHALRWSMDDLLPDAELFHATEHLLPPLRHVPTVLTVHDLVFERYPRYHKVMNLLYLKAMMPMFCARADAIVSVSQSTKADLIALYGVSPDQIHVVPEAAGKHFAPQTPERVAACRERYWLPDRYIVSVGTIEPRKNLSRLVDACSALFADRLIDGLVLVGARGWLYDDFFRHLEAFPWRERVILPGFVPDADLPAVYAGALLTVVPSLYEGFGLPVLEGMACGSPVCASNSSSIPEVCGHAARLFDPTSVEEMTHVLRTVLQDEGLRSELQKAGLRRSSEFSWDRTAKETIGVYERVAATAK